jgi:hypothetical protein
LLFPDCFWPKSIGKENAKEHRPFIRPEHLIDLPVFATVKAKHRNNLIRLIFIHLLLLAYPLFSKTLHAHQQERAHRVFSLATCIDKPEELCPVCDSEFYNFITSSPTTTFFGLPNFQIYNSPAPRVAFIQNAKYFSLRAPPVA